MDFRCHIWQNAQQDPEGDFQNGVCCINDKKKRLVQGKSLVGNQKYKTIHNMRIQSGSFLFVKTTTKHKNDGKKAKTKC